MFPFGFHPSDLIPVREQWWGGGVSYLEHVYGTFPPAGDGQWDSLEEPKKGEEKKDKKVKKDEKEQKKKKEEEKKGKERGKGEEAGRAKG